MKTAQMKVELIDRMGSDLTVVNAARVSFDKESDWEKALVRNAEGAATHFEEQLSERDTKLIAYLAKHNHWSPFAHTSIQLRVKAPIFVARQLVKHQVGGVWNEVSRRYVDSEPEFWFPEVWRGRPEGSMKQGSCGVVEVMRDPDEGGDIEPGQYAEWVCLQTVKAYKAMIQAGVAPEQARMVLPQNMMTEWYWTGSLYFFARVCKLRLDAHAQAETREIAEQIAVICRSLFPVSWTALMED